MGCQDGSRHLAKNDVDIILWIPLRDDEVDLLAWHPNAKGKFSVKSAYKLYIHELEHKEGLQGHSGGDDVDFNWKRTREYQVTNKMKHFIGRLAHNSLPLRQFLKRRGRVKLETIYPMCHQLDEHGGHLFLRCKSMHQLWRSLRLEEKHIQLSNCSSANMS